MNMMNRKGFTTPAYQAAIYCRLSKDDELQGESASISNQDYICQGEFLQFSIKIISGRQIEVCRP